MSVDNELYQEGLAIMPGICGAKLRKDARDVEVLLNAYIALATSKGIALETAWMTLFTASSHWLLRSAVDVSEASGKPIEQVIQAMSLRSYVSA